MRHTIRPRLIEDSTGRKKLKISLPGGRYQLSLDDRGVNLLCDRLGYGLRDTVPDTIVRLLVATGDAWFPHQRDYESVIDDLPDTTPLPSSQEHELVAFLRSIEVPPTRLAAVRAVVADSPLAERINPDEIEAKDLPSPPAEIFDQPTGETKETTGTSAQEETGASPTSPEPSEASTAQTPATAVDRLAADASVGRSRLETSMDRLLERDIPLDEAVKMLERQFCSNVESLDVFDIPGVGTIRGYTLINAGMDDVPTLAETRPVDLAEQTALDEDIATAIIEHARELVGVAESTAAKLAKQTNVSVDEYKSALSLLAAAGVPPSAAEATLRELYGPSLIALDSVDARMGYFLYEGGYKTPWELTQASVDELSDVDYLGPTTAERVIKEAQELIDT